MNIKQEIRLINSLRHLNMFVKNLLLDVYAGINFIQNYPPWDKPPGHNLKGAKTLPPGTIIVYKNPPVGTEQGVKSPTPWDIKLENFTNISMNSDTI